MDRFEQRKLRLYAASLFLFQGTSKHHATKQTIPVILHIHLIHSLEDTLKLALIK